MNSTDDRIRELIRELQLKPHPEGGYFREVYRSAVNVQPTDDRNLRTALTTIYFLLADGQMSRWHAVASDEAWHFYEGAPLELLLMNPDTWAVSRKQLGTFTKEQTPVSVVPAGHWQAARSTGPFSLAGCTVAPGFDFNDFRMLSDDPSEARNFKEKVPELVSFL